MKKKVIILIMLIISTLLFCEKVKEDSNNTNGLKGGINIAKIKGNGNCDNLMGFFIGCYMLQQLNENFILGADLLYSKKGAKIASHNNKSTIELSYIDVPFHIKHLMRTNSNNVKIQPFIGITPSVLLKGEVKMDVSKQSMTITKNLNTLDVGFNIGIDFKIKDRLIIGASYTEGLTNIYKESSNKVTNSTYSISINTIF